MKQFTKFNFMLIAVSLLLIFGCTCNVQAPQPEDESKKSGREEETFAKRLTLPPYYGIVNCAASDFGKLASSPGNGKRRNALFLKYQLTSTGLTLAGWQFKRIQQNPPVFGFSNTPDLTFNEAGPSSLPLSVGSSLGDLILSNTDIRSIKDSITKYPTYPFLVFTPSIYGAGNQFVGYSLSLSNSPTALLKDFKAAKEGGDFRNIGLNYRSNPIPPGGGDILDVQ